MRVTIIADDKYVSVDGIAHRNLSFELLDKNIRAIQWFGEKGEIEFFDFSPNETITSFEQFDFVVDVWKDCHKKFIEYKKSNPPNDVSTWNETSQRWELDPILIKKTQKPNEYSVWSDKKNDWVEDKDLKANYDNKMKVAEAKAYLNNTDFYYIRKMEIGQEIPEDIIAQRIKYREFLTSQN